jgi:hypothetical protein
MTKAVRDLLRTVLIGPFAFVARLIWGDKDKEDTVQVDQVDVTEHSISFEQLTWEPDKRRESLDQLYKLTVQKAQATIDWYTKAKPGKKRWAQSLRMLAIVLTIVGGVIPILAEIEPFGVDVNPTLASIAIAAGGGAILLDRFFGFSSSWIRFIVTKQKIEAALQTFRYEWEAEKMLMTTQALQDLTQTQVWITKCAAFAAEVQAYMTEETMAWVDQFKLALQDVEKKLEAQSQIALTGAVNVTVENGNDFGDGWQLYVDARRIGAFRGISGAARDIAPGLHVIKVIAQKDAEKIESTKAIQVLGGQIVDVPVKLA